MRRHGANSVPTWSCRSGASAGKWDASCFHMPHQGTGVTISPNDRALAIALADQFGTAVAEVGNTEEGAFTMQDVLFIVVVLAFFAVATLFVVACDHIIGPDEDSDLATPALDEEPTETKVA
jgi:hypothetical protein